MRSEFKDIFESFSSQEIARIFTSFDPAVEKLHEAMIYAFSNGGKRFRPLLSLATGHDFAVGPKPILGWSLAVEMIHTYSLIHDDLPCMDNDLLRRGLPTVHVKFGESTALLAGDALLTAAFEVLSDHYDGATLKKLLKLLTEASGTSGMIGGQAIDLGFSPESNPTERLEMCHQLKTGALIEASIVGVGVIVGLLPERLANLKKFSQLLGLAFQVKDDLLDAETEKSKASFTVVKGARSTEILLSSVHEQARAQLDHLGISNGELSLFVEWNRTRAS